MEKLGVLIIDENQTVIEETVKIFEGRKIEEHYLIAKSPTMSKIHLFAMANYEIFEFIDSQPTDLELFEMMFNAAQFYLKLKNGDNEEFLRAKINI